MKEKHHVELSKTCWVYSASRHWFSSWRKAEGQGDVRGSASCAQIIPVLPPVLPTAYLWVGTQASTEELAAISCFWEEKDFNQGGMKGGSQTEDWLSGVADCLVQIVFLTLPRRKENLVSHLFPVCSQRALKERAKLHGACWPALCAWVLPYHGTCWGKRCHVVFLKNSTERGTSALTKHQVCTKLPSGAFALLCAS